MISSNHAEVIKTSANAGSSQRPEIYRCMLRLGKLSLTKRETTAARIHLNVRYNQHCPITERSWTTETMTREDSCCCPSPRLSRDSARFFLLFLLIAIYMLAGAALFSSLERPAELLAHRLWERRLNDFSQGHNITVANLKSLLSHYEEARTAGIRTEKGRALWDIPGSFYFVGTVVSTIGKSMDCHPCYNKIALNFPNVSHWKSEIIGCIYTETKTRSSPINKQPCKFRCSSSNPLIRQNLALLYPFPWKVTWRGTVATLPLAVHLAALGLLVNCSVSGKLEAPGQWHWFSSPRGKATKCTFF